MRFVRKLIASLSIATLAFGVGSVCVYAQPNKINNDTIENSGTEVSEFSFTYKETLKSDANTNLYQEYYTTFGQTIASDTIIEELYITVDKTLTYALRDSARKSYSFNQAFSASKTSGNYFEGAFVEVDGEGNKINHYNNIYQFYRTHKNSDGYAQLTEEIVPELQYVAKHLQNLQSEDLWPSLCYYKHLDIAEGENPYEGDTKLGEQKLVYGDPTLDDKDAFVLLVMGDGFTNSERDLLYAKGNEFAQYLMKTSPFTEFTNSIKIYAMSVDSNESGVSCDKEAYEDALKDIKDTYFGTSFWCGGMQRLVSVSALGLLRINRLMRYLVPNADYAGLLVNSTRYGGSGGTYCTCSLNESAKEIFIHEIAHTIADLADEYFAGTQYLEESVHANMTNKKKTEDLPWVDFYGLDGVGKYAYVDDLTEEVIQYGGNTWYKPCDKTCKMEILWDLLEDGTQVPVEFCPVCKEALRKAICRDSNITNIFYQPYNRIFKDDGLAYKLSSPVDGFSYSIFDYVFLRRGTNVASISSLNSSEYNATITNENGEVVLNPKAIGTYTVSVSFLGNATYDAIDITFTYEIVSFIKEKGFISVVDDAMSCKDYNQKYSLILEAIDLYETVNKSDANVVAAKANLDLMITEFNSNVDAMNQDSIASISIASNLIYTVVGTILLALALSYVAKKSIGGM